MTTPSTSRFDRVLPGLFDELADARTPDYLEAAIERASSGSQRPVWTFPGRWLPMDITTRVAPGSRVPWRLVGVLAVLALLIAAMLAVFVGTQPRRLPAPFGPAANGTIAYASGGDIVIGDASGAEIQRLTSGPRLDSDPLYAPDGQRLAFLRATTAGAFDLMVVPASGGEPATIAPAVSADDVVEWAPDSRWLVLSTRDGRLLRVDATTPGDPTVIATDARLSPAASAFRPPDGAEIMFTRDAVGGLWAMRPDGSGLRLILDNPEPENRDFRSARWSPDGSMIAFSGTVGDGEQYRIHVMAADGTGLRRLSTGEGIWVEADLRWSPDGDRIAFNHWQKLAADRWDVAPVGIISVTSGDVTLVDEAGVSDGTLLEWSPDGTTLTALPGPLATHGNPLPGRGSLIDVASGAATELPWSIQNTVSWQRIAP